MRIPFTKMQGAGNDFIVLDETRQLYHLTPSHYRQLCDRHYGVGADQVLLVRTAPSEDLDFAYHIVNADGDEVAQCGNGARCFVRYVVEKGLTTKKKIRILTLGGIIEPSLLEDGNVMVDMGVPIIGLSNDFFHPPYQDIPLSLVDTLPRAHYFWRRAGAAHNNQHQAKELAFFTASIGNPHALCMVDDVTLAPVLEVGSELQNNHVFPQGTNVGFMQILSPQAIKLRVYERGSGETLACGTGACAAVAVGKALGKLAKQVKVQTCGGELVINWEGDGDPIYLHGPAKTVFEGAIELAILPE